MGQKQTQPTLKLGDKRIWVLVGGIIVISAIFQALPTEWQHQLRYTRSTPIEWWRFVTAQFLHLGWMHWLLNMLGLILITAIFNQDWTLRWMLVAFVASSIFINAALWWLSPEVVWYVGLSGVLHGLLGAGVVYSFKNQPVFSIGMGVLVVGKILWEQIGHQSIGTEALIGGKVLFDAHLYGLIGGSLAAIVCVIVCRNSLSDSR